MLRTTKNTEIFEAVSETPDGITVMTFKAEVDKADPTNSALDVKKESESLYRQYRDMASSDRTDFENQIFRMIDEIENLRAEIVDGEYEEIVEEGGDQ